jgi:radical SAM superfamily enzyme YgiQ (UPF0313 family)
MKVVFVYPAFGSLAIESLAAMARAKGHSVSLVFDPCLFEDSFVTIRPLARVFRMKKKVVEKVSALKPDVVAFSVVTSDFLWFKEMAALIKAETGALVIAGNIHATSAPEEFLKLDFVDAVVRGEGDLVIADILDSIAQGGISPDIDNVCMNVGGAPRLNPLRPLIQDLDSLPFPDKTLYADTPVNASDIYTIMASRGCPYRCTFCNNDLMKKLYGAKGYVRTRSVANVIEELSMAVKTYNSRHVNFYDEVFGAKKEWMRQFAHEYKKNIGLPYIACANPNMVDEEHAALLRDSGCVKVDIGVQTINEKKRREIYNRAESTDKIRKSIRLLQEAGIFVAAENIANFPTESESDMVEMARFYNETRPDVLKVFWLRYFPGTEIINIALRHGALKESDLKKIDSGEHVGSITIDNASPKLHRKFYILYVLTQVLPRGLVESIINKRLYRLLPTAFLPGIAYTAYRLLMKKSPDAEIMMRQHAKRYKFYLKEFFTGRGGRG